MPDDTRTEGFVLVSRNIHVGNPAAGRGRDEKVMIGCNLVWLTNNRAHRPDVCLSCFVASPLMSPRSAFLPHFWCLPCSWRGVPCSWRGVPCSWRGVRFTLSSRTAGRRTVCSRGEALRPERTVRRPAVRLLGVKRTPRQKQGKNQTCGRNAERVNMSGVATEHNRQTSGR